MGRTLAMKAFLGHETRSGGSGSQFLRGWRKRESGSIDVVLHKKAPIVALWQHGLPRIFEQEDKKNGSRTRRVFSGTFNCLEEESVLVKQYRRDRNTGERVLPPVVCPVCRLLESLRGLYETNVLSFTEPLFRWEGDDPNETQELTLGGMLNLYGKDELSQEQRREMKSAGVKLNEAWKQNAWSKCNYLFVVVDTSSVEDGVQIAIETTALGDCVKECIHGQMTSLGEQDGNPMLKPYAIRWEHHPKAREFNKRYKAIAMPRIKITDEIVELIESEPPQLEGIIKPGNITQLRAELESRCILKDPSVIPWDDIFGPAEKAGFGEDSDDDDDDEGAEPEEVAEQMAATRASKSKSGGRRRKKEPEPEPEPEEDSDEEKIPCDDCGFMMGPKETVCQKCGAEYEATDDEPTQVDEEGEPVEKKGGKSKGKGKVPF